MGIASRGDRPLGFLRCEHQRTWQENQLDGGKNLGRSGSVQGQGHWLL